MRRRPPFPLQARSGPICAALLLALLTGCTGTALPEATSRADFSAELIDLKGRPGPPKGPKGACWQTDTKPAVIETITEQALITPESRDASGRITRPAVFGSESRQRIISERAHIWFRSPCPATLTPDFIATLQRALKARGLYLLPLTGQLDAPTRSALGRYQRSRGLDSEHVSLAAAQELGLIAPDWTR